MRCRLGCWFGGLYPLELYLAMQTVEGLADGMYHYDARAHQLELRRTGVFHADIAEMIIGQDMIRDANLVIMITAIFERTMWKYGQRGYRYVWLDAGHVAQNFTSSRRRWDLARSPSAVSLMMNWLDSRRSRRMKT